MASRTESAVVNIAGLVQGIVLVTFPAASTIFTEKSQYGLSSSQYGAMFLPQVATAITASLLGSGLARRISTKRVYLTGLTCSLISMGLLIASTGVKTDQSAAYPLPGCRCGPGHGPPAPHAARGRVCRRGSGSSRPSPCCTASARR